MVLSPIEQRIKEKIEKVGKPLKDWDISIYRGILTGYNEAFIIDGKTKDALIEKSSKNAEIIRPILRGRDIKRYKAEFADLWLLNVHNGTNSTPPVNINDYPEIKTHLDQFYPALEKRQDKGITPYNLRSCIYTDDFSRQKIVWLTITDRAKFIIDSDEALCLNSTYIMTGNYLYSILICLNSKLIDWYFDGICVSTGEGTNKWEKFVVEKIPIPESSDIQEIEYERLVNQLCSFSIDSIEYSSTLQKIYEIVYKLYDLTEEEIAFIENQ